MQIPLPEFLINHKTPSIFMTISYSNVLENAMHAFEDAYTMLDNRIKIFNAWEYNASVKLNGSLTKQDLIELHDIEEGYAHADFQLIELPYRNYTLYKLYLMDDLKLAFTICEHNEYTPLNLGEEIHSLCLRCEHR